MPTTSFSKTAEATTAKAPSVDNGGLKREEGSKAVAVRQESQVGFATNDAFSGSWDRDDVRLPRINLVHKTSDGDLIEKFGIGSFVFNKEVKLSDGKTPIAVVAVRALKDYVQKLPFGESEMPTVFKTPEEVEANGGSLDRKDADSGNFFDKRAHIQFLIAAPEGASDTDLALFPYERDGKFYAMAILTATSSGYTTTGRELATLCMHNKVMRKGMQYGSLELMSEECSTAKYKWLVPVIKYRGENSPALVAFVESLLS